MECEKCGSHIVANIRACPQCGHATEMHHNNITDTLQRNNTTDKSNVVSNWPTTNRKELKSLAIRSFILGLIFPVSSENILLGKLILCFIAVVIAFILFGFEKLFVRIIRVQENYGPIFVAGHRGGAMLFIVSYLQNGDLVQAIATGFIGGFIAAGICKFELRKKVV